MESTIKQPLTERIQDFIVAGLREEYPYMSINAVHEAAAASRELLNQKIQNQQSFIEASKQRSGFLSLSAELRNRIYDIALRPEHTGDGGVDSSRAIFIGVFKTHRFGSTSIAEGCRWRVTSWTDQPALTKLNRQIRAEALPVYYSNHFVFEISVAKPLMEIFEKDSKYERQDHFSSKSGPVPWFRRIGPSNIAMIKHLDVIMHGRFNHESTPNELQVKQYFAPLDVHLPETAKFLGTYKLRVWWKGAGPQEYLIWRPLNSTAQTWEGVIEDVRRKAEDGTLAYVSIGRDSALILKILLAKLNATLDGISEYDRIGGRIVRK